MRDVIISDMTYTVRCRIFSVNYDYMHYKSNVYYALDSCHKDREKCLPL